MNDSNTSPATSIILVDPTSPVPTSPPGPRVFPDRLPASAVPGDTRPAELVAQILGIALDKAADILARAGGLADFTYGAESDLIGAGVPKRKVNPLRAAFKLARLSIGKRPIVGQRLAGAADVYAHMRARLSGLPVEEFWAIAVDVRHRVIFDDMLARGSLTGVEIHPRDAFRPLIKAGAAAVLFCHNHPSGNPTPSRADIELTTRLRQVGDLCGIPVLDHVVVGADGYVSLAERNWL
jgi:DNA repair protein RadC